jgi:NET1-associated nuclear protein 1 (U3 small nucleolar RNA-associated protein 17)
MCSFFTTELFIPLDPAISFGRSSANASIPLAAHSISSSLILPSSHPSTLQTYSPLTSTLISELEVSPSNRVSRREEQALEPCRVEFATTSDSGDWMATVDARPPLGGFRGEAYLKLWWWDRKAGSWVLNTRIDRPHGLKKVTSVSFRPRARSPTALSLVTSGEDGCLKIWGIRLTTNKAGDAESKLLYNLLCRLR